MVNFILYLIESGLCLTLLYLVYFIFFRKETYFNFNRLYLISIMVLALIIPLVHVTIAVTQKDDLEETFDDIGKIRSYYTQFLAMAEGEFYADKYTNYKAAVFEDGFSALNNYSTHSSGLSYSNEKDVLKEADSSVWSRINYLRIFIYIYLIGVMFFIVRLVVLLYWLAKTIKSNPRQVHKNYKLVLMEKEVPPFSFFRYIFINKDSTKLKEFEQVLTHEQVHVAQLHSLDLIVAHVITVFQWFNPLVWYLQKAIKTTHEYIADSKVVSQGFELFDYQSLLLNQLVSIQSVELVNNFNLISIKKRITMMTKNKSRFTAKLKALVVIPVAIIAFVVFADMTVKSPALSFSNFTSAKVSNLDGVWMNNSDTYGKLLKFESNNLSVLEKANDIKVVDLNITIKDDRFLINRFGPGSDWLKYELSGSKLKIWWSDAEYSEYTKTTYKNSFEAFKPKFSKGVELPVMEHARILDKAQYLYNIYVLPNKYYVDDVECTLKTLKSTLQDRVAKFNKLDRPYLTARLVIDKDMEMKTVYDLYQVMRESFLLKLAYGSFPENASELQFHMAGIPQVLPPLDAIEMDESEVGDRLIKIVPGGDVKAKAKEFKAFILEHPDYIASYQWKDDTKYSDYLAVIDMAFDVLYGLRDEYAMTKYKMLYADLPNNLQKEARKKYPMRISQSNQDRD